MLNDDFWDWRTKIDDGILFLVLFKALHISIRCNDEGF